MVTLAPTLCGSQFVRDTMRMGRESPDVILRCSPCGFPGEIRLQIISKRRDLSIRSGKGKYAAEGIILWIKMLFGMFHRMPEAFLTICR